MHRFTLMFLVVCLAFTGGLRAEQVAFDYRFHLSLPPKWLMVGGDGPISLSGGLSDDGTVVSVDHVSGAIHFTQATAGSGSTESGDGLEDPGVPGLIPLGHFQALRSPTGTNGAFSFVGSFDLDLTLTDLESGESGTLTFFGALGGDTADLENGALGAVWYALDSSLTLGNHRYLALIDAPEQRVFYDGDAAFVHVSIYVNPPEYQGGVLAEMQTTGAEQVPEPSSLFLGLAALGGLVGLSRQRRLTLS